MSEASFEALFAAALAARGPAYVKARQDVLDVGPRAIGALKPHRASPDWREALQANILTGWLVNAPLFRQCIDYVDGKLPGKPGITGEFDSKQRARAIAELGSAATPCLLELLMKVRGLGEEQQGAVFAALQLMHDRLAVEPLVAMLEDDDPLTRLGAAGILGAFADPKTIPPLRKGLTSASQPEAVRASAAASLGTLGAREALPDLRGIIADERLGLDLRKAAVRASATLKDPLAIQPIATALESAHDLPFVLTLIAALGDIGDRSAIPVLNKMKEHPDAAVREAAEDAESKLAGA